MWPATGKKAHFPFPPFFTAGRFLSNKYRRRGGKGGGGAGWWKRYPIPIETAGKEDRIHPDRKQRTGELLLAFSFTDSIQCEEAFLKTRQKRERRNFEHGKNRILPHRQRHIFYIIATKGTEGEPLKAAVGKGFLEFTTQFVALEWEKGPFPCLAVLAFFWRHARAETVSHISGEKRKKDLDSLFFGERNWVARAMQKNLSLTYVPPLERHPRKISCHRFPLQLS